ncbi:hypothetical protein L6R46_23705 [Myxococcota bacterium]|jgi:hypothetical protein|nr:hypothetical protein [Myxococcota bacterium]
MRLLPAALALLSFTACENLPTLGPKVTVVNQGASMECDKLSLRCHKVSCSLQSASSEAAAVTLTYRIFRDDGTADQHTEAVSVGPKELKVFSHDFKGGSFGSTPRVECAVAP